MEFLRPTDNDLKSALHTLIGSTGAEAPANSPSPRDNEAPAKLKPVVNLEAPLELTPGPNLAGAIVIQDAAAPKALSGDSKATPNLGAPVNIAPPSELTRGGEGAREIGLGRDPELAPGPKLRAGSFEVSAESQVLAKPPSNILPGAKLSRAPVLTGEGGVRKRSFAIREATTAADGHSRAEQDVYMALWNQAEAQLDGSRLITIGMLALARLSGLSESNARINLRSLQRKLAVEEHSTFVCEQSQGRTWRVFSPDQIVARRREAGMIWYMKRTLAVVFVNPDTGSQLSSRS